MTKRGFQARLYRRDCFIETDYNRRTKSFAKDFLGSIQSALGLKPDFSPDLVSYLQSRMLPCTAELKTLNNGNQYVSFTGENFGMVTTPCPDPTKDPELVLILKTGFEEE